VISLTESSYSDDICFCPLYGLLDVIGKKWALLIIALLGNDHEMGFNMLRKSLTGISPKTLSDTLKRLEENGIVNRRVEGTSPPKVRYTLTPDGCSLRELLIPMLRWVADHGGHEADWCPVRSHPGLNKNQ